MNSDTLSMRWNGRSYQLGNCGWKQKWNCEIKTSEQTKADQNNEKKGGGGDREKKEEKEKGQDLRSEYCTTESMINNETGKDRRSE